MIVKVKNEKSIQLTGKSLGKVLELGIGIGLGIVGVRVRVRVTKLGPNGVLLVCFGMLLVCF